MGAQMSVFVHDLRTPTRSLHSKLELPLKSPSTFSFTQEMKKGVGEDQTLITRVVYTGRVQEVSQDVTDHRGKVVKGNPLYLLHPERVQFEVEWGTEWYQMKKGRLVREDVMKAEKEGRLGAGGKKKITPIVTSTTPPPHPHLNSSTAITAPPSPSSNHRMPPPPSFLPSQPVFTLNLPPANDVIPRGFSHSAPLSPAPLTLSERQRSHVDVELGLGERPVQTVTALDKSKVGTATSNPSLSSSTPSPSSLSPSTSPILSLDSPLSPFPSLSSFLHPPQPRTISVTFNGSCHTQLQQSSSLEEMTELLQQDTQDWVGTFSPSALVMRVEVLSEEVKVEYFRPKFEYLWAQVMDDCPIIMALSNVFHDSTLNEMYLPRAKA